MDRLERFRVAKCCGFVDLRLGTLIILGLDCLYGIGALLSGVIPGVVSVYGTIPSIVVGIITIVICLYAIHGVLKDKPNPLLYWIYYEILVIIFTLVICILSPFVNSISTSVIPVGIINIIIMAYLIVVVYSYYREMSDGGSRGVPNV